MPVGYGDNPPVGAARPEPKPSPDKGEDPAKQPNELPPAGPHDDPALTNPDSTPGTGALPPAGGDQDADGSSG
jgi:hypothetical protein